MKDYWKLLALMAEILALLVIVFGIIYFAYFGNRFGPVGAIIGIIALVIDDTIFKSWLFCELNQKESKNEDDDRNGE